MGCVCSAVAAVAAPARGAGIPSFSAAAGGAAVDGARAPPALAAWYALATVSNSGVPFLSAFLTIQVA